MSACAWACGRLCGPGLLRHDRGLWTAGAFPDLMPQGGLSQHRLRKGQVELSSAGFGSLGRREAETLWVWGATGPNPGQASGDAFLGGLSQLR